MSAWPGKFVIGLTGNIATGKSIVRKMLEHLGAYGIDADALGHRAIAKGSPGYQPVVDTFGKWILGPEGEINRDKLSRVVFTDEEALASLEAIVHPLVGQAIDFLMERLVHKVVVIEAIKLIEAKLHTRCDTLWVTHAAPESQLSRLVRKRGMSVEAARQRTRSQPPQQEKLRAADTVIYNTGSFEETWRQVTRAWKENVPTPEVEPVREEPPEGEFRLERAHPRQAEEIAGFITQVTQGERQLEQDDVMAAFGEKAYLLLKKDGHITGLLGWRVENLIAHVDDVYLPADLPIEDPLNLLVTEMERLSHQLMCEAALVFLHPNLARYEEAWRALEYEPRSVNSLSVRAWQEAALESMPSGTILFFKQLREDRILRPV